MAAIKPEAGKALAALTSAALCLPGLNAQAATPSNDILSNVSFGHYQESDKRMVVDIYHADALIPLSDRLELAFSLDRDTYSGASPAFSLPETMTNQLKTESGHTIRADIVSSASPVASAAMLTTMGLNTFIEWQDTNNAAQAIINTRDEQAKAQYQAQYDASVAPFLAQNSSSVSTTPVTINFDAMKFSSFSGKADLTPLASGNCSGSNGSGCYYENGMVFGIVNDPSDPAAHIHRNPGLDGSTWSIGYHSDSPGIFFRAQDSQAFSLNSMRFSAPINASNLIYGANPTVDGTGTLQPDGTNVLGANEFWQILGFNTAKPSSLSTGNGSNYATLVAYQTVANGFNGTLTLNSAFHNVKSVWIHYNGYPSSPQNGILFALNLDNVNISPAAASTSPAALIAALTNTYNANLASLAQSGGSAAQIAALTATYNANVAAVNAANATYQSQLSQEAQLVIDLNRQAQIAAYRQLLDRMVPTGTPTLQRFQMQPLETRSQPQFNAKYYFDSSTLAFSGGLSDEPDFLSNFGSVTFSHEFNDKLTTVSGSYGLTSNTISRNTGMMMANMAGMDAPQFGPTRYPTLNESSTYNAVTLGLSQVLSKNTLFQTSVNYTNQSGYLSNPYKNVYIRGVITPEQYYDMSVNNGATNWSAITNLQVVGIELFRENRPNQRNIWSFSNQLNQHIPALDATLHFDYRFYTDDWGVNSHTFAMKWFQSLPWGLTVTPGIRYYSQSQAEFFAPYFLAPRADGHYSSDYRLSAFGDLSGGVTISKKFTKGVKLETSIEYVTHSGGLKLGGGGVGSYADFDYYIAHANLNVDLSAKLFSGGDHGDSGHAMHHRHHGAPLPAGVMFGHMLSRSDEMMVGYRYMYSGQNGSMLHGGNPAGDPVLAANACPGKLAGCLYKPASMHMQMHMLDFMYAPSDWLNLMLMPQLVSMDMTMSKSLTGVEDATMPMGGVKMTSNNLGDTVMTALVKALDDDGHHVHAGLGVSAPTGSVNIKMDSTNHQDYGMQTGSGTWDFKPSLTYTGQDNDWGWGAQFSGVKRLQKNKYGYAFGDIFQATGWGSYRIFNWLSASVRSVYTVQDKIHGETSHFHLDTASVDYTGNYGGRFWDAGFGLNVSIPEGRFAGHHLSFEWLQPVSTDYNGYQLDRSGALSVSWSYAF